jgi:fatty-acid desaturase
MEFAVTDSFVKALEGVYASGVLEDPVLSDVKQMIDLSYQNGSIDESIEYMNSKYNYHIVRNMHQLFLQVTKEGALETADTMDNMLLDIDMLVESVYRDRIDRATFHKSFLQYGVMLYLMVMLVQYLLGVDTYIKLLDQVIVQIILHAIIIVNSYFLLSGEKYYNENVGAE